jgi:hypothetical protein
MFILVKAGVYVGAQFIAPNGDAHG